MSGERAGATSAAANASAGSGDGGPGELADRLREVAGVLGLDAFGIASAEPGPHHGFFADWWAAGYGGAMDYLGRRAEERMDPRRVLPGCRSILVGALFTPGAADPAEAESDDGTAATGEGDAKVGRVARYAGGDDYHDVLLERMRALEAALPALAGRPVSARSYVDTGPVLERAAAAQAGLGWIGKNTLLIHPELGSHVMLGVVLTDLELPPDVAEPDHCGTCRACLDVCPTDAFPEPYVLDATRCLSYTTIELREAIPESLRESQGDHVFGCDLCQTVCPWNRSRPRVWPGIPSACARGSRRAPSGGARPWPGCSISMRMRSRRRVAARRSSAPAGAASCGTRWSPRAMRRTRVCWLGSSDSRKATTPFLRSTRAGRGTASGRARRIARTDPAPGARRRLRAGADRRSRGYPD